MKVAVSLPRRVSDDVARRLWRRSRRWHRRDRVGITSTKGAVDDMPSLLPFDILVRITVDGVIYDLEKAAFERAMDVAKRLVGRSGWVVVAPEDRPREVTNYLLPSGPEGDAAYDAVDADFVGNPRPGSRYWWPGVGWATRDELDELMSVGAKIEGLPEE